MAWGRDAIEEEATELEDEGAEIRRTTETRGTRRTIELARTGALRPPVLRDLGDLREEGFNLAFLPPLDFFFFFSFLSALGLFLLLFLLLLRAPPCFVLRCAS